jgi:hypothetical protein
MIMRTFRRVSLMPAFVALSCLVFVAASAYAQGVDGPATLASRIATAAAQAPNRPVLRSSAALGAPEFHLVTSSDRGDVSAQRGYGGRRGRGGRNRALMGFAMGAVAGFAVGGAIGVATESRSSCGCDDPALHGFLIGAPIGAGVGAFLGMALYH